MTTTTDPTAGPTVNPPTGGRRDGGLVNRAVRAARTARHVDPGFDARAADHRRTAHRRALAHAFAAAYGLVVTDDPARRYGTWRGFLITVTDNGQDFTFLPVPDTDGIFLILGSCPGCDRQVPLADASDLPALGRCLDAIADDTEPTARRVRRRPRPPRLLPGHPPPPEPRRHSLTVHTRHHEEQPIMSTRTDFYDRDRWLGSLATDADPRQLLTVPPGRLALSATDPFTFADAVDDLLDVWVDEQRGTAHHPRDGWPWPWPDSTASDWIVRFHDGRVEIIAGHYTHWNGYDPPCTTPAAPARVHVIAEIIDQRFQVSIVHHPGRYTEYTLPAHGRTYRDAIADTVHRHTGRTVTAIAATGHVGDGAHRYTAALADQPELAETSGHNARTVTP